jgi:uncharacterized protein (UPF0297 family)
MKVSMNAVEIAMTLNKIAPTIQDLGYNSIIQLFSKHKIPYYTDFIPYLTKQGYLKGDHSLYTWVKKEPIYYKEIESFLNNVRNKKKQRKIEELTEEDAIAFLKNKGYKIMKPIVEYTEI